MKLTQLLSIQAFLTYSLAANRWSLVFFGRWLRVAGSWARVRYWPAALTHPLATPTLAARWLSLLRCYRITFLLYRLGAIGLLAGALLACHKHNDPTSPALTYTVSTLAGTGTAGYADGDAAQAKLFLPTNVAVDASGTLYVADWGNGCLRRISPDGQVSLFAGSSTHLGFADGPVASSLFSRSVGLVVNAAGTELYVTDTNNHRIRKLSGQ